MALDGFDRLHADADSLPEPVPVVAAGGDEPGVIVALHEAAKRGWVVPTVVGPERGVRAAAEKAGVAWKGVFRVVDASEGDAAAAAVAEVKQGRAKVVLKGRVTSADLVRALCHPERGLRAGRVVGQVVLMEVRRDDRRFLLTDTGVNIRPTLSQKVQLLRGAVDVAQGLGVAVPRVAVMAASEAINVAMHETLDAAALQTRNQAGDFPGCVVQGPLSFELAYDPDAADTKNVGGAVAGKADVFLFADLLSANLTVKAIMYTADCRFGGVLIGTTSPVAFMSRADSPATRLNSLALALRLLNRPC